MVPRTRSFDSARPRGSAGEGSSAAPLDSFAIAEKVLGTATGEISFSPKEAPSLTLQRELRQRFNVIRRGGVCLGRDPALIVNPNFIVQIAALKKGAQALV